MRKVSTLVLVQKKQKQQILLGMKKRGFGVGKWNGFGGKVEAGESVFEGAIREIQEEAFITPVGMRQAGLLAFDFPDGSCKPLLVHVFKATEYEGEISESEEMKPAWFANDAVPFEEMWEDDKLWFPYMFEDRPFVGRFTFKDLHTMVKHDIKELGEGESFEELAKTI
jgi:ADP-ribose pyrophosphatase YjhB (NUDIX family)|eukprot:g2470.t1